MNTRETLKINQSGHLEIGGVDTTYIAEKYGTPVYVMDEKYIRDMCKIYTSTINKLYGEGKVLYASKAFSCLAIYKIVESENLGADVVSEGELFTALKAGFNPQNIYFHGNNKLPSELLYALNNKVGTIVVDSLDEMEILNQIAKELKIIQPILLRVNPGVEAHTHHFIQTSRIDSKFGFSICNGDAKDAVKKSLSFDNLKLKGVHSHIGSQIFEKESFGLAVNVLTDFIKEIKDELNYEFSELNMGGGYGIWYTDEDRKISVNGYAEYIEKIITTLKNDLTRKGLKKPYLVIEPGRSLVGEAGITLYTVGNIKEIKDVKKYVNIDGGMFDNPRFALYQAKYTPIIANRAIEPAVEKVTIAGKCCESGDIIAEDVMLAKAKRGDILAVFSTGAYNYSMASNYNRNKIPQVLLARDGKVEIIVKAQTNEDLVRNDIIPVYLK